MSGLGPSMGHREYIDKLSDSIHIQIDGSEALTAGTKGAGLNCDRIIEPVPQFDQAASEVVFKNENNAWIVLGRDRPYSKASGYGGSGGTSCGMIDLVVGRVPHDSQQIVNNNFISDAARIYISQRTDIDANMRLCKGRVGMSTNASAIGIKADEVRIVARRGIKLITGSDRRNSHNNKTPTVLGIDLIAGNDDGESGFLSALPWARPKLQPIPKGLYTRDAIDGTLKKVEELGSIVQWMLCHMMVIAGTLAGCAIANPAAPAAMSYVLSAPGIPQPGGGPPGLVPLMASYQTFNTNCDAVRLNHLLPGISKEYICSRHNRTN